MGTFVLDGLWRPISMGAFVLDGLQRPISMGAFVLAGPTDPPKTISDSSHGSPPKLQKVVV